MIHARSDTTADRSKVTGGKRTVSTWLQRFVASLVLLSIVLPAVETERDAVLYCGACIALVEELNWLTGITNPKLKIQVGSFHLDAKGNSGAKEIPLATSETYLTEIYETVCRYTYYYAKATGSNGHTNYILTQSRDGQRISMKNVEVSNETRQELRYACDWVLEEFDDWMVPLYKAKDQEIATKLCIEHSGLCKANNVTDHIWAFASAVMAGQTEQYGGDKPPKSRWQDDEEVDDDDVGDYDDEEEEEIFADETDESANAKSEL